MRSYLIDEIAKSDIEKIEAYLEEYAKKSGLSRLFWIGIPDDLLSERQYEHAECKPHVFAVELGDTWLKFELFTRNRANINCTCCDYATRHQINFVLNFANTMIQELEIKT
jgi:hypothetical protein